MRGHSIRTRTPRGDASAVTVAHGADAYSGKLEDAAHYPGGHAAGLATPTSEAAVAEILRSSGPVLPIGAQSSLTGGATPMGETLLDLSRMNRVIEIGEDCVRVQAGVTLADLDAALLAEGKYYPPAPTFMGATVGGVVATNAAGAATFKYGTTRDWVRALTVVLPNGEVLDVVRGVTIAHAAGYFEIASSDGTTRVPLPTYRMPDVPKVAAGYFAAPGMDLVDLFVGSEGTLGVVTEATLAIVPRRPSMCLAFVPFSSRTTALTFVDALRREAIAAWQMHDRNGLDVSAIEHMDARCLALLREDGVDRKCGVTIAADAAMAMLVTLELNPAMTPAQAFDEIGRARERAAPDTPLVRFCRALEAAGVLDSVEIAVPGDTARAAQLLAVREAVPEAVNARVGRAQRDFDARIAKTAADMIVPFDRLPDLLDFYDAEFARRGLDAAVWGHVSDGNLHPNVIPRSYADVESGIEAIRAFGREVIRLGGSPLAEHGVGRNRVKHALLTDLYGTQGIREMRSVKESLDPQYKLAPGVIFQKP
jgi:D-lactate dehydrogenase (cytochrome)